MKNIPEPVRWMDAQSDAPDEVRKLLSVGQDAFAPRPEQLDPLASYVAGLGAGAAASGASAGGGAGAAGALGKGGLLKLTLLVVVGSGVAGAVWTVARGGRPADRSRVATRVAEPRQEAEAWTRGEQELPSEAASAEPSVANVPSAPPAPVRPRPPSPRASAMPVIERPPALALPSSSPPETELGLLRRARTLLAASPSDALRVLDESKALFPHGVLEQEREVLAIDALMRAGRVSEARARAGAFRTAFPGSALDRRLWVLLGERSDDK